MSLKRSRLVVIPVIVLLSACKPGSILIHGSGSTAQLEVPDVANLDFVEAKTALTALGFRVQRLKQHSVEEKGTVIAQEPAAGTPVGSGALVTITTSLGTVIIPNVVGLPYSRARSQLREAGLVVKRRNELVADSVGGAVQSQMPREGSFARPGRVVTLTVTTPGVPVPDVTDMSVLDAELTLTSEGLKMRVVPPDAAGIVLDQTPKPGTLVRTGSRITTPANNCDPNYTGCLKANALDYDCVGGLGNGPLYTGTVRVVGFDHYGLDADGDGYGCE